MTDVRFYHLLHKRLEQALPELVAKALEQGHRILIRAGSAERVEALDTALWTAIPESFLPHSRLYDEYAADQPVFLTQADDNPNGASVLMLCDGAACRAEELDGYKLCCCLFDDADTSAVEEARRLWKIYKEAGHDVTYYQQGEGGGWVKK